MKKIVLLFLMLAVVSISAMAGSDLTVIQGDKKFMKAADGNAVIEFVWDGATYDYKQPLAEKFENLEELKNVAWNGFAETFNKKSKKVKIVSDAAGARYKFVMQVKNMDQYFKVMGFIPGNATKVWGTMNVTDLQTGETIAVIEVKEVNGGANPSPNGSFSDCFEELAKQIVKLK